MPAPNQSTNGRRSWRTQGKTTALTPETLRVKRIFFSMFGLTLVALFVALLVYQYWPQPRLRVVCLTASDYKLLSVPPIAYYQNDVAQLQALETAPTKTSIPWEHLVRGRLEGLRVELEQQVGPDEILLVYISAHGIHEVTGEGDQVKSSPCLLCSDFTYPDRTGAGRFPVTQLLDHVSRSSAKVKLLVLDTGRMVPEPRMGIFINEFPSLLIEAVQSHPDPSLWVMHSNSMLERSHVSSADRQSVFGFYLNQGLAGRADGFFNRQTDRAVHLDELAGYVQTQVSRAVWTISNGNETQSPVLMRGGTGVVEPKVASDVFLTNVRRSPPIATPAEKVTAAARRWQQPVGFQPGLLMIQTTPASTEASGNTPSTQTKPAEDAAVSSGATISLANAPPLPVATATSSPPAVQSPSSTASPPPSSPPGAAPSATGTAISNAHSAPDRELLDLLETSWRRALKRRSDSDWTPIDYAPQLWRQYIELIRGYRERMDVGVRFNRKSAAESFRDAEQVLLEKIAQAESVFLKSRAHECYTHFLVQEYVKLRNLAIFVLEDEVQGRDSTSSENRLGESNGWGQAKLQDSLEHLRRLALDVGRPRSGATAAESADEWRGLCEASSAAVKEDLRSLTQFWAEYSSERKPDPVALADLDLSSEPSSRETQMLQRVKSRAAAELRLAELAATLTDPERLRCHVRDLDAIPNDLAKAVPKFRLLGRELQRFYLAFPERVREARQASVKALDHAQLVQAELLIRFATSYEDVLPPAAGLPNPLTDAELRAIPETVVLRRADGSDVLRDMRITRALSDAAPLELGWQLKSTTKLPARVSARVDYKGSLVVSKADGSPLKNGGSFPATFVSDGERSAAITIKPRSEGDERADLTLTLFDTESGARLGEEQIHFQMPKRTDVEIIVRDEATSDERVLSQSLPRPNGATGERMLLRPLPLGVGGDVDRSTSFHFDLVATSGRELKAVAVKILEVPRALSRENGWSGRWWDDPQEEIPKAWKVVREVKSLDLPGGGEKAKCPLAASAPTASPAAGKSDPPPSTEAQSLPANALVCVVEFNTTTSRVRKCVWLDVVPRHPRQFMTVTMSTDVDKVMQVPVLSVTAEAKKNIQLPPCGIVCSLETVPPIGAVAAGSPNRRRIDGGKAVSFWLPVVDGGTPRNVYLNLDGYPRGFIRDAVRFDGVQHLELNDFAPRIHIARVEGLKQLTSPDKLSETLLKPEELVKATLGDRGQSIFPGSISQLFVQLQADVFSRSGDQFECFVGTALEADGRYEGFRSFPRDRAYTVQLLPSDVGALRFEARADDLMWPLDIDNPQAGWLRAEIRRINANGDQELVVHDPQPMALDSAGPEVAPDESSLTVRKGEPLVIRVRATDQVSGVESVKMALAESPPADFTPFKKAQPYPAAGSPNYLSELETKDLAVGPDHMVYVQARDRVGNSSGIVPIKVQVLAPLPPPTPTGTAAGNAASKPGRLIVELGRPAEDIDILLTDGPKDLVRKTDGQGRAEFPEVPPGAYKVSAKGFLKGSTFYREPKPVVITSEATQTLRFQ